MVPSPLLARLAELADSSRAAVEDDGGVSTFQQLLARARTLALAIDGELGGAEAPPDPRGSAPMIDPQRPPESQRRTQLSRFGPRVALLASPGRAWVEAFLAVVIGRRVVVPLSPLHPVPEQRFYLEDSGAELLLVTREHLDRARELGGVKMAVIEDLAGAAPSAPLQAMACRAGDIALLLYTSGTTGKPKGAMITHANLAVQARLLDEAWGWTERDSLLHALPLHHLHGLGISLLTALLAGARVRMLPRFDARRVWDELGGVSGWMAVPTMYQKLIEAYDAADDETRARWSSSARALRVATSGSAALPASLAERWRQLTGAIPLERFGMTEIGVGMTNPLDPAQRRAGWVGKPLPTVGVRLVDDEAQDVAAGVAGEMWIRGPSVFEGYWHRDDATEAAFTQGWFRTGDVAERDADGFVRVLGRTSVDILKSGGYKLSALEIEEVLREHPAIAEVAVVGLPDDTWGDRVVAVIVAAPGRAAQCEPESLRTWAKERLAPYKVPRQVVLREELPRNAVGKVIKPDLVRSLREVAVETVPRAGDRNVE